MKKLGLLMVLSTLPLVAATPAASAKRSFESLPPAAAQNSQGIDPELAGKVSVAAKPNDNGKGRGKPNDNGNGGGNAGNAGGNGNANGCGKGKGQATGCNDSPG
jgi:hypothetical protein